MAEAVRKDARWKSVVANARAIHGAAGECLKLADQMSDAGLKGETMLFVNAMEHLAASLLKQRRRIGLARPSEKELVDKLREEALHIRQLLEENQQVAREIGDAEAKENLVLSIERLNRFTDAIDRKRR